MLQLTIPAQVTATIFNYYGMTAMLLFYDYALNNKQRSIYGTPLMQKNKIIGIFLFFAGPVAEHLPLPDYREWIIQETAPKIYADHYPSGNTIHANISGAEPKGMSIKAIGPGLIQTVIFYIDSNGNWFLLHFYISKKPHSETGVTPALAPPDRSSARATRSRPDPAQQSLASLRLTPRSAYNGRSCLDRICSGRTQKTRTLGSTSASQAQQHFAT